MTSSRKPSLSKKVYLSLLQVWKFLERGYTKLVHIHLDSAWQKQMLRGYTNDIKDVISYSDATQGNFCIFVYYEPGQHVSNSVRRVLEALKARQVEVLLVCNHALSPAQLDVFSELCHSILLRGNQGFDFGAFKDAVSHMAANKITPDRLILMNDSVFFAKSGLDSMISGLLEPDDVIATFENWGEDYHLQSFALSMSSSVMQSEQFQKFWASYVPVNNRVYAIENGEKKLSKALISAARSSQVIFSVEKLVDKLIEAEVDPEETLRQVAKQWRDVPERLVDSIRGPVAWANQRKSIAYALTEALAATSTIHSGAYYFPKYMNCPMFKKDLVYRQRFDFWEIAQWSKDILVEGDRPEFFHMLRQKGDANSLSASDRRKYDVGVK